MNASREFIASVPREEVGESVGNVRVTMAHFEDALDEVNPSVTPETRERYAEIEKQFQRSETADPAESEFGAFQ
jgi:transitional endoplasmic reticulum ATPase